MAELPRAKDVRACAVRLLLLAMPTVLPPGAGAEETAFDSPRAVAAPGDREALLDFYHRYRKAEAVQPGRPASGGDRKDGPGRDGAAAFLSIAKHDREKAAVTWRPPL
jgi:hypothetical protein